MKASIFLLLLSILISSSPYLQADEECVILNYEPTKTLILPWNYNELPGYAPQDTVLIELAIHIIRDSNGNLGIPTNYINIALQNLRQEFAPVMIKF